MTFSTRSTMTKNNSFGKKRFLLGIVLAFLFLGFHDATGQCSSPATVSQSGCAGTYGLKAQTYNLGVTQFNWYTSSSGGSAFYSSSASSSVTYNSSIYSTYLSSSTTYYVSVVCNGSETSRAPVSFTLTSATPISISASQNNVAAGTSVTLTGNNGTGNNYNWYKGTSNGYILSSGPSVSVTSGGTYYANGTNNCGNPSTGSIFLNYLPTSDPGPNQTISASNTTFVIYGSGYDPEGHSLTFTWTQPSGPAATLAGTNTPTLTVSNLVAGTYDFRLKVDDQQGGIATNDMILTVTTVNNNYNYVKKEAVLVPGNTSASQVSSLTAAGKNVNIDYADGLGRKIQSVAWQATPSSYDLVSPVEYDDIGRARKSFLPVSSTANTGYFHPNETGTVVNNVISNYTTSEQYLFYNSGSTNIPQDTKPFTDKVFANDPLGRVMQDGSVGAAFQPGVANGYKSASYGTNTSTSPGWVRQWQASLTGYPTSTGLYPAGTLQATTTTDEQGLVTTVYTNREGLKILTRVFTSQSSSGYSETYYVYDTKNRLRYTLTPEFIKLYPTNASSVTLNTADLDNWCYQLNYDSQDRVTQSKGPGADWAYYVYDLRDRVVLTQDGNQRQSNTWMYTKYDGLNRPVSKGIYSPGSSVSLSTMQSSVNSTAMDANLPNVLTYSSIGCSCVDTRAKQTIYLEPGFDFAATSTSTMYAHIADPTGNASPDAQYPVQNIEKLTLMYYDSYSSCPICQDPNYAFVAESWSQTSNEPFQSVAQVDGKVVGSSVKILGTNTWLNTVTYYNRQGQVIQTIGGNHLGGRDRISSLFDFSGKKIEELQTSTGYNNGGVSTLRKIFSYDAKGRVTSVQHQINNQPVVTLASYTYNELGQVIRKSWPLIPGGQNLDYRYNIRGWMTNMNNLGSGLDDANDYFGMDFTYNTSLAGAGNIPRYDGMISAIRWKQDLGNKRRVYNFSYDDLKRTNASSEKMDLANASTWTGEPDFYTENGLSYDLNGNIKTLSRNTDYYSGTNNPNQGTTGTFNSAVNIDQLTYTYSSGNQLSKVDDAAPAAYKQFGFTDGANTGNDYTYDQNGNLTSDQNKKISSISYYFNNLVNRVTLNDGFNSYIQYTYDAAGIKLNEYRYIYDNNSSSPTYQTYVTTSTDYVGNIILLNGQVLTISHPDGRITAPTYENILTNPDAGSLDGYNTTSSNVALSAVSQNAQTYVTAVNNQTTTNEGIFPLNTTKGTSYPVVAGQSYSFKVLGYQTSGTAASLYVKTNLGDLVWPGASLPTGSANENWATVSFTVPSGATSVSLGVKWNGTATGNTIYINRIALYKTDFEYNFFMTDQVGSTRVVLQTNPGTQVYTATMEAQNQSTESAQFQNMSGTAISQMVASPGNHTPGGSYAFKLNGAFPVGPAKSIKVYPGDKIDASVYSYFVNTSGYNSTLNSVGATVASTFGGVVSVAGDPGAIYQNVTNAYAGGGLLAGHTGSSSYPSAYLNYILFDKDYNPLQGQSFPISQTPNSPQSLAITQVTATEIGYIYLYLTYENTNTNAGAEVYFDDFKITVQESPVIQVNNYYPFGLRSYTWLRGGETDNAFLFQGKELLAQTGWHDFGSRMYAAELGRWFATDPQQQFSSPYLAMGNMPMMGTDPNGEFFFVDDLIVGAVGFAVGYFSYALTKHDWGIKALESGAIGALIAEAGYLTLGGGLAATANIAGSAAIKGATQFAILDATTIGTSVAENQDKIGQMSDGGALEAIAGIDAVSALQSGFQTDFAEEKIDRLFYGSKNAAGWFGKGVTSDAVGGLLGGGIKTGQGGFKWDWADATSNSVGAGISKATGNLFDKSSEIVNGKNSYLRNYKGKTPPTDVAGATAYTEKVINVMNKRLLAGKEIGSVLAGQWATNQVKGWYGRDADDYWKDTNVTNIGSGFIKDGMSLYFQF